MAEFAAVVACIAIGWALYLRAQVHRLTDVEISQRTIASEPPGGDVDVLQRHERALFESEERFSALTQLGSDVFWETDSDDRFVFMSNNNTELSGLGPEQVVGHTAREYLRAIGLRFPVQSERTAYLDAFNARAPFLNIRCSFSTTNDEERHLEISGLPIVDELGEFHGYRGVSTDVTSRVNAGKLLSDSEARFKAFVDHSPMGFCMKDVDGRYLFLSRQWQELFDVSQTDLVGRLTEEVDPEISSVETSRDTVVIESGRSLSSVSETVVRNEQRTLLNTRFPIRDASQSVVGIGLIMTDITELRHAEQALHESEARFRAFMDNSPHNMSIKDLEGRNLFVNAAFEKFTGHPASDLLGHRASELFPGAVATRAEEVEHVVRTKRRPVTEDLSIDSSTGVLTFSSTCFPIFAPHGELIATGHIDTDITELRLAQHAAQESDARLRGFMDNSPSLVSITDTAGRYVFTNRKHREADRLDGFEPDALIGKLPEDVLPRSGSAAVVTQRRQTIMETRQLEQLEQRQPIGGEMRDFLITRFPLVDADDVVTGVGNILTDVTELKAAERALRDTQARFRAFVDYSPLSFCMKDLDGRYLYVNRHWEQEFSVDAADLLGKSVGDVYPEATARLIISKDQEVIRTAEPLQYVRSVPSLLDQHTQTTIFAVRFPILDAAGEVIATGAVNIDITEQERVKAALFESEARFRAFMDNSPNIMAMKDTEGRYLYVNPQGEKLLGQSNVDLVGKLPTDLFPKDSVSRLLRRRDRWVCKHRQPLMREERVVFEDEEVYERTVRFPIVDEKGELHGTGYVRIDLTDRMNAEIALRQAHDELEIRVTDRTRELADANDRLRELDNLKSLFIASMSHELRTPLNSIIGFTGIILKGMSGDITELQAEQLQRVHGAARHLLALITDVIDISKIEAGKLPVHTSVVQLREIIEETIANLKSQVDKKALTLRVEVPNELAIYSDRKRLLQCLLNLVSNAVKYSDTGEVVVRAAASGEGVNITVTDPGIGIAETQLPELFQPFGRLGEHVGIPGTGLGLYLTNKIVTEMLEGKVGVESTVGSGSTFSMRLPGSINVSGQN